MPADVENNVAAKDARATLAGLSQLNWEAVVAGQRAGFRGDGGLRLLRKPSGTDQSAS
jgi:hypothetical protein